MASGCRCYKTALPAVPPEEVGAEVGAIAAGAVDEDLAAHAVLDLEVAGVFFGGAAEVLAVGEEEALREPLAEGARAAGCGGRGGGRLAGDGVELEGKDLVDLAADAAGDEAGACAGDGLAGLAAWVAARLAAEEEAEELVVGVAAGVAREAKVGLARAAGDGDVEGEGGELVGQAKVEPRIGAAVEDQGAWLDGVAPTEQIGVGVVDVDGAAHAERVAE